jgi:hypothetical protein
MAIRNPGAVIVTVDVTARTIQVGDVVNLGGQAFEVLNLIEHPGQGKALRFTSGEVLTMHSKTRLAVNRAVRKWGRR